MDPDPEDVIATTHPAQGARVASLHRYPVKGLQGEALTATELGLDGVPWDRALGLSNGSRALAEFGSWTSYEAFDALATRPDLGSFGARVLGESPGATVRIQHPDGAVLEFSLAPDGRMAVDPERAAVVDAWFGAPDTAVDLVSSGAHLWDVENAPVSVVNLATVEALAQAAGRPVEPARFRANVYLEGLPAWAELDLVERTAVIGGATLEFFWPIDRCSATSVRPGAGRTDLNVPGLLTSRFGHIYCGVYARVLSPGPVQVGDSLAVSAAQISPVVPGLPESARGTVPRWARVARVGAPARHVVDLELIDSAGVLTQALPGQHLRLHHTDGSVGWRNYTISGTEGEATRISVRLEDGGRVSPWIHGLTSDAEVLVSGPFGDAVVADGDGPLFLITGGIGITPTLPILRALGQSKSGRQVTVVHVARTMADVPHWDEVLADVAALPAGSAYLFLTAEADPNVSVEHHSGRPAETDLRALMSGTADASVHLCGSPAFTDAMRATAEAAGVRRDAIRFDPFYSPPVGDLDPRPAPRPGPFRVNFPDGRTATWSSTAGTLLELADANGQRIPASCRSGVCGTCITDVRGDTAYVIDPWVQPASGSVVLCCAVPTGDVTLQDTDPEHG